MLEISEVYVTKEEFAKYEKHTDLVIELNDMLVEQLRDKQDKIEKIQSDIKACGRIAVVSFLFSIAAIAISIVSLLP